MEGKTAADLKLVDKHFPFPRRTCVGLKKRQSIGNDQHRYSFGLSLLTSQNAPSRYSDGGIVSNSDCLSFEGTVDRIIGRFEA